MREGIALGLMVTYANLTDSIKTLSCDDEIAVILEKIACLNPLEENGFDVGRFRTRLRQLLKIKTEYMESESRISRLELQLEDKETEVAYLKRFQLEMEEVSREINWVQETINTLKAKRDRLLHQTVGNGHEISRLKEAISDLNRLNEPARQEFATLLAKPL
jgi:chromosome segregation ATPase